MQGKGEDGCRRTSRWSQDCENDNKLRGVLFLDDNARPHTARGTKKKHIRHLGWERLDHPAYSLDIAPSGFHLSPALKSVLSGRHFRSNDEVHQTVKNFLRSLGTDFYQDGFLKFISRQDKCIKVGGQYAKN
ncbi:Histone-lysine N-methyltransferase SETMAR [Araneus ventricosus]|uniref:Histone-lysine N-methyltransferase SETMAR n=1 Tax=Araneus ventricosus TaxID=182803 RepID=A0A4Y2US77_ARAVE|nr:Histone-lysine N-methyltransferase SETMAR [Araneus ventricosus]